MKFLFKFPKLNRENLTVVTIVLTFFIAYSTLGIVKHIHFMTGYDLSVANQVVWEYSRFLPPINSLHAYAFTPIYWDHIEFIFILLAPFYWILPDPRVLIILQAFVISVSAIPIYLLAKKYKINTYLLLAILISYLTFFGIQNAMWSDVHSLVFATSFLAFFIYFLDVNKKWPAFLFFLLALTSKEDIGLLTFLISFVYFIKTKNKINLLIMIIAAIYVLGIFFIFFPYFAQGYRFANEGGILSNFTLLDFFNTKEKQEVIFYTLNSFGFLPVLNPLLLLPYLGDLGHYFILGGRATSTQSIFLHYRVSSALLLVWPTILIIGKFKKLNNKYLALYILFFAALTTYMLHAPLTYLTKRWFWTEPSGVENIKKAISQLPKDAYIVTQANILPHTSTRKFIVTMWGDGRTFREKSPCGKETCEWFKWAGEPKYMIIDTSPEWNILHLLANREDFIKGLENMEKYGVIKKYKEFGSSTIYTVHKRPY